jgi:hypothetical protein
MREYNCLMIEKKNPIMHYKFSLPFCKKFNIQNISLIKRKIKILHFREFNYKYLTNKNRKNKKIMKMLKLLKKKLINL